jgi:DNA helicase-2/ATP-dependent DNA helicase PcrA
VRSGLRFFEQAHIKDVTAYLRLAHNALDPLAWQRILRLWPGVGNRSSERIVAEVQARGAAGGDAAVLLGDATLRERLPRPARPSVERLAALMGDLQQQADVEQMIEAVVRGHYQEYAQAAFPNAPTRLDDLRQLGEYAARFDSLEHFLSELALVAGVAAEAVGPGELPEEKLTLSTVHQAKGLEWRAVFILWLVETRFPQAMAVRNRDEEEEERRLFHVAVTRAMDHLYLCQVQFEESDGLRHLLRLSRFLVELAGHAPPYERWEIEELPP